MDEKPETPPERAGFVVWLLVQGHPLSTAQIAERLGLSRSGTWKILSHLSRWVPIWYEPKSRTWRVLFFDELPDEP